MGTFIFEGCFDVLTYYVSLGSNPGLNVIYSFSSSTGTIICGRPISTNSVPVEFTEYTGITSYSECYECLTAETQYTSLRFTSCIGSDEYLEINQDLIDSGFLPIIGYTYDLIVNSNRVCLEYRGFSEEESTFSWSVGSTYSIYGSCDECESRERIVEVFGCDNSSYYTQVPNNTFFNDVVLICPIGEYVQQCVCGVVGNTSNSEPDAIFSTNYGPQTDGCLFCSSEGEQPNENFIRRKLISCLDGSEIVLDVSSLFNLGESTYVTINDSVNNISSCYQIGELTNDPLSSEQIQLYQQTLSCQDCVSCSGAYLHFSSCTNGETGYTITQQYINIGEYVFIPTSGCSIVLGYSLSSESNTGLIYQAQTFTSCTECENYNPSLWLAQFCGIDNTPFIVDMTEFSGSVLPEQVYKFEQNLGDIDRSSCFTILSEYSESMDLITEWYYLSNGGTLFNDCETCIQTTSYVFDIVECGTSNHQLVNISGPVLIDIINFANNFGLPIMKTSYGTCYTFGNVACSSQDISYSFFEPSYFFTGCTDCNQPFSAGTESTICVICCPCGSTGSTVTNVSAPHPTWTNLAGKAVVLLDAVQLGGMNGLNN